MIIDKIYELLNQLSSKSTSGGYLPIPDFNNYALLVQNQKINFELSDNNDTTFKNEMVSNYSSVVNLTSVDGVVLLPSDYRYFDSASYYNTKELRYEPFEELSRDEWNWRRSSDLDAPTTEYPALIVRKDSLNILPKSIQFLTLEYINTPDAPIYGYSVVNGRRVFDINTSTDFVFKEENIPDIVYRMSVLMSIELRDSEEYQFVKQAESETK